MNLLKAALTLTMAFVCILPLAVSTGCTGPPSGTAETAPGGSTENQANTSQPGDNTAHSSDYSNTTN